MTLVDSPTLTSLQLSGRRARSERIARILFLGAGLTSVLVSGLILWSLARETWTFVSQV